MSNKQFPLIIKTFSTFVLFVLLIVVSLVATPPVHAAYDDPAVRPEDQSFFYTGLERFQKTVQRKGRLENPRFPNKYSDVCTDPSLVASYHFNDLGSSATEETDSTKDLRIVGNISTASGEHGRSAIFDGSPSYLELDDPAPFNFTHDFTIDLLFYQGSLARKNIALVSKTSNPLHHDYYFGIDQSDRLVFSIDNFGLTATSVRKVPVHKWTHLTAVFKNSPGGVYRYQNTVLRVYIDGVESGRRSLFPRNVSASNSPLVVGAYKPGAARNFLQGKIDELRFYDFALFSEDIKRRLDQIGKVCHAGDSTLGKLSYLEQEKEESPTCTDQRLIALYHFNKDTSFVRDETRYKNHGTIFGATKTPGKFHSSLTFADAGYVEVPASDSLNPTNNITIDLWYYLPRDARGPFTLVSKFDDTQNSGYKLTVLKNNHFALTVNGQFYRAVSSRPLQSGKWNHITAVYSGGNTVSAYYSGQGRSSTLANIHPEFGNIRLYLDGKENGRMQLFEQRVRPNNKPLLIGVGDDMGFKTDFATGTIDELAIYNFPLAREDILDLTTHPRELCLARTTATTSSEPSATIMEDAIPTQPHIDKPVLPKLQIQAIGYTSPKDRYYINILNRGQQYGDAGKTNRAVLRTKNYLNRSTRSSYQQFAYLNRALEGGIVDYQTESPDQLLFQTRAPIRRKKFAELLVSWFGDDINSLKDNNIVISDIGSKDPALPYIKKVIDEGYMQLYTNNTFEPNAFLTRSNVVRTLMHIAHLKSAQKDKPISEWFDALPAQKQHYISRFLKFIPRRPVYRQIRLGQMNGGVLEVKKILQGAGRFTGPMTMVFDEPLTKALVELQLENGIIASRDAVNAGKLESRTRLAINKLIPSIGRDSIIIFPGLNEQITHSELVKLLAEFLASDTEKSVSAPATTYSRELTRNRYTDLR